MSEPRYCNTEDCYRNPDIKLFIGMGEAHPDGTGDYERWACEPCYNAMIDGNQIPGQNIQVLNP